MADSTIGITRFIVLLLTDDDVFPLSEWERNYADWRSPPEPHDVAPDSPRLGWLDFLRFLAVSLVIGRHTLDRHLVFVYSPDTLPIVLAAALGFGWSGVSLFFIISGFIVGGPLCEKISQGKFRYWHFLTDRALRILPAALAVAVVARALMPGDEFPEPVTRYAITLFASNYLGDRIPATGHYWSLAVEQHFYLLAPALIAIALSLKRSLRWLALLVALFAVTRAALPQVIGPQGFYTGTFWQLDYFALGVLLYFTIQRLPASAWFLPAALASYVAFSMAVTLMNGSPADNQIPDYIGTGMLFALIASAFVFVAAARARHPTMQIISRPWFRFLGVLSYSLYLVHLIVINESGYMLRQIDIRLHHAPASNALAAYLYVYAVSFVAACCLHFTAERGGLWIRERIRERRKD